tara:strand:- start:2229 stop:2549 length:321 start_codon:yes stop_codon:yes gene_type:complete
MLLCNELLIVIKDISFKEIYKNYISKINFIYILVNLKYNHNRNVDYQYKLSTFLDITTTLLYKQTGRLKLKKDKNKSKPVSYKTIKRNTTLGSFLKTEEDEEESKH